VRIGKKKKEILVLKALCAQGWCVLVFLTSSLWKAKNSVLCGFNQHRVLLHGVFKTAAETGISGDLEKAGGDRE
jgi:hypothetical protein